MPEQKETSTTNYLYVDRRYIAGAFVLFVLPFVAAFSMDLFSIESLGLFSGTIYIASYLGFFLLLLELARGEKRRLKELTSKHCIQLNKKLSAGTLFFFSLLFFASAFIKSSMVFTVFVGLLFYTAFLLLAFVLIGGERRRHREVNESLKTKFEELPELKS